MNRSCSQPRWRSLSHGCRWHHATSRASSLSRTARCKFPRHGRWRRSLHRQTHDIFATNQDQTQTTLFRTLFQQRRAALALEGTELLRFAENQVQVLIKRQKRPNNISSIVQSYPQTVLDIAKQLAAFSSRLRTTDKNTKQRQVSSRCFLTVNQTFSPPTDVHITRIGNIRRGLYSSSIKSKRQSQADLPWSTISNSAVSRISFANGL